MRKYLLIVCGTLVTLMFLTVCISFAQNTEPVVRGLRWDDSLKVVEEKEGKLVKKGRFYEKVEMNFDYVSAVIFLFKENKLKYIAYSIENVKFEDGLEIVKSVSEHLKEKYKVLKNNDKKDSDIINYDFASDTTLARISINTNNRNFIISYGSTEYLIQQDEERRKRRKDNLKKF